VFSKHESLLVGMQAPQEPFVSQGSSWSASLRLHSTLMPVGTLPVKLILSTSGWSVSQDPTSRPPVTTFTTPAGSLADRWQH
jgi:hypothetical protein